MPRKGWEREPARHSLAGKGVRTKFQSATRKLKTITLNDIHKRAMSEIRTRWHETRPIVEEAIKSIKTYEDEQLSDVDQRILEDLESAVLDVCADFAIDAMQNDDDKLLTEIEKAYPEAVDEARDILRDDAQR